MVMKLNTKVMCSCADGMIPAERCNCSYGIFTSHWARLKAQLNKMTHQEVLHWVATFDIEQLKLVLRIRDEQYPDVPAYALDKLPENQKALFNFSLTRLVEENAKLAEKKHNERRDKNFGDW